MPSCEFHGRQIYTEVPRQIASRYTRAEHFDNLAGYCAPREMTPANYYALGRSLYEKPEWNGIEGGADAVMKAVEQGWPEGVRKIEAAFDRIVKSLPTPTTTRRERVWADHGDSYDPHRAMSGSLDRAWRSTRRQRTALRDKRVTIVMNGSAAHTVEADPLFWRGAAALAMVDALSQAGYTVELIVGSAVAAVDSSNNSGHQQFTASVVKPGQPVDIGALAATLCLAGMFRTYGFVHIASSPFPLCSSFGYPAEVDISKLPELPDSAIYVGIHGSPCNEAQAIKFVADKLAEITGEA